MLHFISFFFFFFLLSHLNLSVPPVHNTIIKFEA